MTICEGLTRSHARFRLLVNPNFFTPNVGTQECLMYPQGPSVKVMPKSIAPKQLLTSWKVLFEVNIEKSFGARRTSKFRCAKNLTIWI
jgi:hypothetical protein